MTRARDVASILTAASTLATDTETAAAISSHNSANDPHTGYLLESLYDAKGDLIVGSADNTPSKLTSGNNGETLVADASTATGLRYQVPVNVNPVINSAFQIWQRGTSFVASSATTGYTADRWLGYRSVAGGTISRQLTGDTTNLPFIQYCARVQRDSGNSSTATINYYNAFESINSIFYAGKTVTVSFYARKGANYSSTTTNVLLQTGTGTDQTPLSGFTGAVNAISSTVTPTTTWARYSYTATLATNINQINFAVILNPLGTAGAADFLEITGVQLEVGSVATSFKTNGATIQGELAACQRYYYRFGGSSAYQRFGTGLFQNTTQAWVNIVNPVPMRTAPTSADFSSLAVYDGNSIIAITGIAAAEYANNIAAILVSIASGGTQFRPVQVFANNNLSAFLGFSAEL